MKSCDYIYVRILIDFFNAIFFFSAVLKNGSNVVLSVPELHKNGIDLNKDLA